jgi:putative transposase
MCYEYVAPMRKHKQLALAFVGSRRRVPRRAARAGAPHRGRPSHRDRHPVHVTLRRARLLPSMREQGLFLAIRQALSRTARSWFRVLQFSVQADHIHLIVEAGVKPSLSRGMTGLAVRIARAFNGALGRRGAVWSERYHSHELRTPREVRNSFVYVLMNHRKHSASQTVAALKSFDVCSSAWWFDGWAQPPASGPPLAAEAAPVTAPETWLARTGWKRHGLVRFDESPKRSDRPQ